MRIYDVIRILEEKHGHKELWFYPGTGETEPDVIFTNRTNRRWPKILKRNGRAVAEFTGNNQDWALMGNFRRPDDDPCCPRGGHALSTIPSSLFAISIIAEPSPAIPVKEHSDAYP